jgi:hypothetical protein
MVEIIYGNGKNAIKIVNYFKDSAIKIVAFCDSNTKDDEQNLLVQPAFSP